MLYTVHIYKTTHMFQHEVDCLDEQEAIRLTTVASTTSGMDQWKLSDATKIAMVWSEDSPLLAKQVVKNEE